MHRKLSFPEFLTQGPGICFNMQTRLVLISEVSMVEFDNRERERERKIKHEGLEQTKCTVMTSA